MKVYNSAPLPFQGQKRNFVKVLRTEVAQWRNGLTVVDLFGGSGLMAHTVKQARPDFRVIYNDFDGYIERLATIEQTNELRARLDTEFGGECEREKRITGATERRLLDLLRDEDTDNGVDWLTVSSWLLFSGKYAKNYEEFAKIGHYWCLPRVGYNADGYLRGVEIVRGKDYKELIKEFGGGKDTVFLADPPYLSTDVSSYTQNSWKLSDYLDILRISASENALFFTSRKSEMLELAEWLAAFFPEKSFAKMDVLEKNTTVTCSSHRSDILMVLNGERFRGGSLFG